MIYTTDHYTGAFNPALGAGGSRPGLRDTVRVADGIDSREWGDIRENLSRRGLVLEYSGHMPRKKLNVYRVTKLPEAAQ